MKPHCLALVVFALVPHSTIASVADDVVARFNSGDYAGAAQLGRDALKANPTDIDLELALGRSLTELGDFTAARPLLEAVIAAEDRPTWRTGWALTTLASVRFANGDIDAAMDCARRAIAQKATPNIVKATESFLLLVGHSPAMAGWIVVETENIRFAFHPSLKEFDQRSFVKSRQDAFVALQAWFPADLPKKIDYFVWPDNRTAAQVGIRSLGFSRPALSVIHSRANQTPGHELVHVLSYHSMHPKIRTGLINEGIAVLFDQQHVDRLTNARKGVQGAKLRELSIVALWKDWPSGHDEYTYPVAGAFVERLKQRGGEAKLKQLLAEQTYAAATRIYGDDLTGWIVEFERDLFAG